MRTLFIDDDPVTVSDQIDAEAPSYDFEVLHPSQITLPKLIEADMVVVDLRLEEWEGRDATTELGLRTPNGLALAVLLREHLDANQVSPAQRMPPFIIQSAHVDDLRKRLPRRTAEHMLARFHNVEWVVSKYDERRFAKLEILYDGFRQVNSEEGRDVESLLGKTGEDWEGFAEEQVLRSQLPRRELSSGRNRMVFARWLLHRNIPYPTFLWDKYHVASFLGVDVDSLDNLSPDSEMHRILSDASYTGVFAGLLGDRWWRAGILHGVWSRSGYGLSESDVRGILGMDDVEVGERVVLVDSELKAFSVSQKGTNVLEIFPDQWPPYADPVWVERELVETDAEIAQMQGKTGDSSAS